jgi:hypothetical protein
MSMKNQNLPRLATWGTVVIFILISCGYAWRHYCCGRKISDKHVPAFRDGDCTQSPARKFGVFFSGEKAPMQPGIVIDLLDVSVSSHYEKDFGTNDMLSYNIRNESREDVFILLEPPPISLKWIEITTDVETYSITYPTIVRGPASWPLEALLFTGNKVWQSSKSFSVMKTFRQQIPEPSLGDLLVEQEPGASSTKDHSKEHFVKGQLQVSFDVTYCVVGKNEMKTQRLEKIITIDAQNTNSNNVQFMEPFQSNED